MKKLMITAFCVAVALSMPRLATAQKMKQISAEDKKAIIEIFKGVDPKMYKLEFKGKESYGARKVNMTELKQAQTIRNPGGANGYIVLTTRDDGVMFFLAVTKSKMGDVLGQEKMNQLNTIMAKYQR